MKTTFYCGPGVCGLKFDSPADRDKFWSDLSDQHRAAAEKIKNRTIRFYPAKMVEPGFQWPLAVPVSNGPVAIHQPAAPPSPPKTDLVTTSPFEHLTQNPTRALPGIVPPPPAEMLAVNQPAQPSPAPAPTVEEVNTAVEIPSKPEQTTQRPIAENAPGGAPPYEDAKPLAIGQPAGGGSGTSDPEPKVDKRSKEWRQWKARQKA